MTPPRFLAGRRAGSGRHQLDVVSEIPVHVRSAGAQLAAAIAATAAWLRSQIKT